MIELLRTHSFRLLLLSAERQPAHIELRTSPAEIGQHGGFTQRLVLFPGGSRRSDVAQALARPPVWTHKVANVSSAIEGAVMLTREQIAFVRHA